MQSMALVVGVRDKAHSMYGHCRGSDVAVLAGRGCMRTHNDRARTILYTIVMNHSVDKTEKRPTCLIGVMPVWAS